MYNSRFRRRINNQIIWYDNNIWSQDKKIRKAEKNLLSRKA